MVEYIEREAAIALYEDDAVDMSVLKVPVPVIVQNLKDIPAADVVPVRHGQWNVGADGWECSECTIESNNTYPICPYCGALMDKDGDGE